MDKRTTVDLTEHERKGLALLAKDWKCSRSDVLNRGLSNIDKLDSYIYFMLNEQNAINPTKTVKHSLVLKTPVYKQLYFGSKKHKCSVSIMVRSAIRTALHIHKTEAKINMEIAKVLRVDLSTAKELLDNSKHLANFEEEVLVDLAYVEHYLNKVLNSLDTIINK